MSSEELESVEIPGIGEFKARPGTSTLELAGGIKYWHDRWETEAKEPRKQGFIAGLTVSGLFALLGFAIYHLWSL